MKAEKKEKKTSVVRKTHGKKYVSAKVKAAKQPKYNLTDAVKLLKDLSYETFDATVEVHANLLETGIKGEVNFPHGTGKTLKIVVFSDEVEKQIKENKIDFDILLAPTKDMGKLVKYARVLGPKGLMPSPKKGTLTDDIEGAKKKFGSGVVNYKSEPKFPIMHQIVGKRSFTEAQLEENIRALITAVARKNIVSFFVKTSMSPSLEIDLMTI